MDEKQYSVEYNKLEVQQGESRLREAQTNLKEGYKKGEAQVAQAKADAEREYTRLKEEVVRTQASLAMSRARLTLSQDILAQGFES